MQTSLNCIPCFLRQALEAAKENRLDDEAAAALMRRSLEHLLEVDWSSPPPVIARDIQRAIREMTGDPDPYLSKKITATEQALALLPEIETMISTSADPFLTAVKVSIAGNVIDLGAKVRHDIDVAKVLRESLDAPIDEVMVNRLRQAVPSAGDVLFLADNAGEIVFDRPLLEMIGPEKVTVVVRGAPTINDATIDDARRAGLVERFTIISNGSDTPGTWLDDCSADFADRFDAAALVIAKGQGNYETLSDQNRSIFFVFMVKCDVVSRQLGAAPGSYIIRENRLK
jgi:uncharacterized protein with ATP-grasp and redox domains